MQRDPLVFLVISLVSLLALGCGSDSSNPTDPPSSPVEGATLALGGATSMDRVGVDGLPAAQSKAAIGDYEAVLRTDGAEDIRVVLDSDEQGWFFRAPLHPVGLGDGGSFVVRITDGTDQSQEQTLTIEGLPAAPGALEAVVDALRAHVDQRAGWAGSSFEELRAQDFADVAEELIPTKIAQSFVDSADPDDHDLTSLLTNEAGFLSDDERELLDRLFGYAPLDVTIQAEIDAMNELTTGKSFRVGRTAGKGACLNVGPEINTAPELSQAMIAARLGDIATDTSTGAGRALQGAGLVLAVGGMIPGVAGPVFSALGVAVGVLQASKGFQAGAYPSSFQSIQCVVDRPEFNEDSEEFATYDDVEVVAVSTGWIADADITNIVLTAVGGVLTAQDKIQIEGSDFLRDAAITEMNLGLGMFLDEYGGVLEICPNRWTVDISSPLYCTAASLSHKFDVDIPTKKVTPKEAGDDMLRVAAQATKFAGQEIHKDVPMRVKQIQVVVTPDDYTVEELGETVLLTAEIHNADLTTLRWLPEWGNWEDQLGDDTNDGRTRPLKTPLTESAYPFQVRIESLSRNGIRSSGVPQRIGYATIRYRDTRSLVIEPAYKCISPGETQQFEATVTGFEEGEYTVAWEITEGYGSIDQNGLYQSLAGGTSSAVIRAKVAEAEEVYGEARIDVSACNCSLDIKITGDARWTRESSQAAYTVSAFEDLFYTFFLNFDGEGDENVSATVGGIDETPSPRPGDTGSWKCGFVYFNGSESWVSVWDDDKVVLPGVSLNITELTETEMVGSFTGNAFQLDEEGEVSSIIGVDVKFRAGLWDGGRWPCE